jgi:uncharacterized protein DUF6644
MYDPMPLMKAIENSGFSTTISRSIWVFPAIEMVHMFGIVALVGATSILDMRLMGIFLREEPVTEMVHSTLKWAWIGAMTMIVTGVVMFASEATKLYTSSPFRLKMFLMVFAAINAIVFHTFAYRGVSKWEVGGTPFPAKLAGACSLLLWFAIVAAGRWVAFA